MLTGRHGEHLDDWMREVDATGAAPLRSFANALRSDLDAVVNGLLPYNSGSVEGTVTRIKALNLNARCTGARTSTSSAKRILHPV